MTAKNIAILGTAPSSRMLAPFDSPDWEIWTCSPGNMELPRSDVHFELHSLDVNWIDIELDRKIQYFDWMKQRQKLYLAREYPGFPKGVRYPIEQQIEKYDQYFFTSSVALMMAEAIDQKPEKIGLWGVDMATDDEYLLQKSGCQFFIREARKAGITVFIPAESDLDEPPPVYGLCMESRMWRKLNARSHEIQVRLQNLSAERLKISTEEVHLKGALEDVNYMISTWAK